MITSEGEATTVAPTSVRPGGRHASRWLFAIVAVAAGAVAVALLYHFDVVGSSSSSTTEGSGIAATQTRQLPAFTAVKLVGSNNVSVRVGARQSVVVRADDNLIDRVTTKVRSQALVIGNAPGSFTTKSPMSVEITVPALDAVTLAGSGTIAVTGVKGDALYVTLAGSGTLTGSGRAARLAITIGGSGTARFTRLVATNVQAVVAGSGSIFVTATRSLDATVSGTGSILYAGNPPQVTKNVTGTGAITGS